MMRYIYLTACLLLGATLSQAQTLVDFESFNVPVDSFFNGSDLSGGFTEGDVFFTNSYVPDPQFPFWSGWAISTKTDTVTAGFDNQYSAFPGTGWDGSETYAVAYRSTPPRIKLSGALESGQPEGVYLTNGTYAYRSMTEGDQFAKKFGGVDGNDPDFFFVTIKGYQDGQLKTDSVDFYLADFRFADNSQDYIVKEWTYVDLTSLGRVDSVEFFFTTSDVGVNGPNTPFYVCVDNLVLRDNNSTSVEVDATLPFQLYPTRVNDQIQVVWEGVNEAALEILDVQGSVWTKEIIRPGSQSVYVSDLASGLYIARVRSGQQVKAMKFWKE